MDAHTTSTSEYKGVGIPLQYHLGLLLGLGGNLTDRIEHSRKRKDMWSTTGVSPRTLLWNIAFDNILKEKVPLGVSVICYVDDPLVVMAEDDISILKRKVNTVLEVMTRWIEPARLSLATMKMEVVLFTCRCST